jgi:glycine cleavage system H lipoate-binding protein
MKSGLHKIIPEGENHCVWMDAGLVNYKLCDKNFECESCPFDTVMKTQHHAFAERATMQNETSTARPIVHDSSEKIFDDAIHQIMAPLKRMLLPNDRMYFSNHSWIKQNDDGRCSIGIDGFLAHLLQPLMGTVMINTPVHLEKDSPFAWIIRDDDTLSLHTPIAGMATEVNTTLMQRPTVLTADPYNHGWILMLTPNESETSMKWFSSDAFQLRMNFDVSRIESLMNSTVAKHRKEIGTSLFDGGLRIETIEQFIGEKRYVQLLSRLLRPQYR